ncbi:MAG: ornithine cyclodeaminase family protein [Anaerolineales bacterium]
MTTEEVRLALPMRETIEAMKLAFGQLSAGDATVPLRSRIDVADRKGVTLLMPALLSGTDELALKVVSVFPENLRRGLPTIHALVVALDPETGQPIAVIEGGILTAIRTGAGSGAATDLLAKPDAKRLAIFGAGVQARTQLEAVCSVREIESVSIFSLEPDRSQVFLAEAASQPWTPSSIDVADSASNAIAKADVVCTATTSKWPVFNGSEIQPGTHVNAIGSFTPTMQEVDSAMVERSLVVVDSREAVLAETGDLIIPIEEGRISKDHIHAELGEIVNGSRPGRTDFDQITFYKSVGVAVQDVAAAGLALKNAERLGLGQVVDL